MIRKKCLSTSIFGEPQQILQLIRDYLLRKRSGACASKHASRAGAKNIITSPHHTRGIHQEEAIERINRVDCTPCTSKPRCRAQSAQKSRPQRPLRFRISRKPRRSQLNRQRIRTATTAKVW